MFQQRRQAVYMVEMPMCEEHALTMSFFSCKNAITGFMSPIPTNHTLSSSSHIEDIGLGGKYAVDNFLDLNHYCSRLFFILPINPVKTVPGPHSTNSDMPSLIILITLCVQRTGAVNCFSRLSLISTGSVCGRASTF